jgi:hypothetical protein
MTCSLEFGNKPMTNILAEEEEEKEEKRRRGEEEEEEEKTKQAPGFSPPANYTDRATAACRRS